MISDKNSETLFSSHINNINEFSKKKADIQKIEIKNDEIDHDKTEPLLMEDNMRFTIYPIKYKEIWDMYKIQQALYWRAEEIDFSRDYDDFKTLDLNEQHFVKMVLAFFAASDGIVNFNLRERFLKDVKIMEAQVVYAWQMMMENVHSETYTQMLQSIVKNPEEKDRLFNAIKTVESVKMMADWAFKWIESTKSFAHRIIAFAIIEGVFFSGAFAAIFWLKRYIARGKHFLNGLIKSNEFIARDEGIHCKFACLLYSQLNHKLTKEEVYAMMDEATVISRKFTDDAIPCKLIGMNDDLMGQYIEFISDRLLVDLGYPKKYKKTNPFDFMEMIGYDRKTNFFETRPTEYQSAHNSTVGIVKRIVRLDKF